MWASQLRVYRDLTDNKQTKVTPVSPTKADHRQSDTEEVGHFSLYSSEETSDISRPSKDLEGCVRLLNDMLNNESGTGPNKMKTGTAKSTKTTKPVKAGHMPKKEKKTNKVVTSKKGFLTSGVGRGGKVTAGGKVTTAGGKVTCSKGHGKVTGRRLASLLGSDAEDSLKSEGLPPALNASDAIVKAGMVTKFNVVQRERVPQPFPLSDSRAEIPGYNARLTSSTPLTTPTKGLLQQIHHLTSQPDRTRENQLQNTPRNDPPTRISTAEREMRENLQCYSLDQENKNREEDGVYHHNQKLSSAKYHPDFGGQEVTRPDLVYYKEMLNSNHHHYHYPVRNVRPGIADEFVSPGREIHSGGHGNDMIPQRLAASQTRLSGAEHIALSQTHFSGAGHIAPSQTHFSGTGHIPPSQAPVGGFPPSYLLSPHGTAYHRPGLSRNSSEQHYMNHVTDIGGDRHGNTDPAGTATGGAGGYSGSGAVTVGHFGTGTYSGTGGGTGTYSGTGGGTGTYSGTGGYSGAVPAYSGGSSMGCGPDCEFRHHIRMGNNLQNTNAKIRQENVQNLRGANLSDLEEIPTKDDEGRNGEMERRKVKFQASSQVTELSDEGNAGSMCAGTQTEALMGDVEKNSKESSVEAKESEREEAQDGRKETTTNTEISPKSNSEKSPPASEPPSHFRSPSMKNNQLRTLQYLMRELRAVPGASKDREVARLVGEIEDTFNHVVPGLSSLDWQTELDLAIQPLRSENAQLRRRLRIQAQQLKDRQQAIETATKPDLTFDVIHLQMLNHSLEKQVKEERHVKEELQGRVKMLASQLEKLSSSKKDMLQLITNKDSDHLKSQQDWVGEVSSLRSQLEVRECECSSLQRKLDAGNHELQIINISLKQKDKEITRLQQLVKSLQTSMSNLLCELQSGDPQPLLMFGSAMDHLQHAFSLLHTQPATIPALDIPDVTPSREVHSGPIPSIHTPNLRSPTTLPVTSPSQTSPRSTLYQGPLTEEVLKEHQLQPQSSVQTRTQQIQSEKTQPLLSGAKTDPLIEMDGTEYLSPPGGTTFYDPTKVAKVTESSRSEEMATGRESGMTVKDLLGGFADKMRQSLSYSKQDGEDQSEILEENEENFQADDREGDSTLVEENLPPEGSTIQDDNQSRYSVTDYFRKYSTGVIQDARKHKVAPQANVPKMAWSATDGQQKYKSRLEQMKEESSSDRENKARNVHQVSPLSSSMNEGDVFSHRDGSKEVEYAGRVSSVTSSLSTSVQDELYRGTELDTSLSSIRETDSVTSGTTISTLSSFDDQAFQEGLASLDANIARVQEALKKSVKTF